MWLILLAVLTVVASVIVSIIVLLKNSKSLANRVFFGFIVTSAVWALSANMIGVVTDPVVALWLARTAFIFALLVSYTLYLFVHALVGAPLKKKQMLWSTVAVAVGIVLSLTPQVVTSVQGGSIDSAAPSPSRGWLYPIVIGIIGWLIWRAIRFLRQELRHAHGQQRMQLAYVFAGISLGGIIGISTNIVLPNIVHNTYPSRYAFLTVIVWMSFFTYAIVKHRLMDLRFALARLFAYVLTLFTLASLYIAIVFGALLLFASGQRMSLAEHSVYVVIVVFLAITFQPLKHFFDKASNRVFYRDGYEPQDVLNKLTTHFAATVNLTEVIDGTAQILQTMLRTTFVHVVAVDDRLKSLHTVTIGPIKPKRATLPKRIFMGVRRVWVSDELLSRSSDDLLVIEMMRTSGIGLIIRLQTSSDIVGVIALGYKQSGDGYRDQDLTMLRIVADELAIAIQNSLRFREIQRFNDTLRGKIDTATVKLRLSNRKLQVLDEAKDDFISMASHQLRTPLTSIKGYLSMVLEGDAGKLAPQQKSLLEEAYGASQRMVYLINDFLNISRLQTGKFEIERSQVNLVRIVEEEIAQLSSSAKGRKLTLKFDPPSRFPVMNLDENKIRQVTMNFIDNAIYYSKPGGGVVTITLRKHAGRVEFEVHDTGIGVPAAERHKLFTKFYRASNARFVRPDGTGIGLFMAKKVIVGHGGVIMFESTENKGSCFGFRLPLGPKK